VRLVLIVFFLIISSIGFAKTESYGSQCPEETCAWRKPIISSPPGWIEKDIPSPYQKRVSFIPTETSFGLSLISATAFYKPKLKPESRSVEGFINAYRKDVIRRVTGDKPSITEKPSFLTGDGKEVKIIVLETTIKDKNQIDASAVLEEGDVILLFSLSSPSLKSYTASLPSFEAFVNNYHEQSRGVPVSNSPALDESPVRLGSDYDISSMKGVEGTVYLLHCKNNSLVCNYSWDDLCLKGMAVGANPLGVPEAGNAPTTIFLPGVGNARTFMCV
jgi:hypothetical protein